MGAYSKFFRASFIVKVFKNYPLARGMASYAVIWPTSSLIQQTFEGKNIDNYDWKKCARFGFYGSCYVAPTLYTWLTIANIICPGNSIKAGLIKTFVESITYAPFGICSFYFFMSLLESKTRNEAVDEVKTKFWPTYKIAVSIWPAITMFNFCVIPPRNRVPFISVCSLIWTSFLAYMKHLDQKSIDSKKSPITLLKRKS